MRQAKLPWLLFVLALVAIVVPIAQGTSAANDPRVPGLAKRITALEKKNGALTKAIAALAAKSNCIGVVGITQYGDPANNDGYMYKRATDPPGTFAVTTALDGTIQGQTPDVIMATINPSCVTGSKALFRQTRAFAHRSITR
jgi:hypothetical protein